MQAASSFFIRTPIVAVLALFACIPLIASADSYNGPGCETDRNWNTGEIQEITCKHIDVDAVLVATDNALKQVYASYDSFRSAGEGYKNKRQTIVISETLDTKEAIVRAAKESSWYRNNPYEVLENEIDRSRGFRRGFYNVSEVSLIPRTWYAMALAPNTVLEDKRTWYQEYDWTYSDEGDVEPKGYYWTEGKPIVSIAEFDAAKIHMPEWNWQDIQAPWHSWDGKYKSFEYVPIINPLKSIRVLYRLALTDDNRLVLRLWKQIDTLEDGTVNETTYENISDLPKDATLKYYKLEYSGKTDAESVTVPQPATPDETVTTAKRAWWQIVFDFLFGWLSR